MKLFSLWLLCLALIIACSQPEPTPTLDIPATVTAQVQAGLAAIPTATPVPTHTPYPTPTDSPTATPYPTATAYPTGTPRPTYTPYPTPTEAPTSTPYPTYTPYPTATPRPTYTPRPTPTRRPTVTPTPRPRFSPARTVTVQELKNHKPQFWLDKRPFMLVGCLAQDDPDKLHGESWYTFSGDGRFNKSRFFANVGGFGTVKKPKADGCYEMVVKYEDTERFCYWISTGISLPQLLGHCRGWRQQTPAFFLINDSAATRISKSTWRSRWGGRS